MTPLERLMCDNKTLQLAKALGIDKDVSQIINAEGNPLMGYELKDGILKLIFNQTERAGISRFKYTNGQITSSTGNIVYHPSVFAKHATKEELDVIRQQVGDPNWCSWMDKIVSGVITIPKMYDRGVTNYEDHVMYTNSEFNNFLYISPIGVYEETTAIRVYLHILSFGLQNLDSMIQCIKNVPIPDSIFKSPIDVTALRATALNSELVCPECGASGNGYFETNSSNRVRVSARCPICGHKWLTDFY